MISIAFLFTSFHLRSLFSALHSFPHLCWGPHVYAGGKSLSFGVLSNITEHRRNRINRINILKDMFVEQRYCRQKQFFFNIIGFHWTIPFCGGTRHFQDLPNIQGLAA